MIALVLWGLASCSGPIDLSELLGTSRLVDGGDYRVDVVQNTGGTTAGAGLAGSFIVTNGSAEDDNDGWMWRVYVSSDPTIGAGDTMSISRSLSCP